MLAVGLGRSYGDCCLNSSGRLVDMSRLDRIIALDTEAGWVAAEAGLSLDSLLRIIVPRGWFLPTTPGTRFVTLGGAVANDVHGKNHHSSGAFGCSVRGLQLVRSDCPAAELSMASNAPRLRATIGGLGLTGIIATVELKLTQIASAYLDVETIPFGRLREFFDLASQSVGDHEHTVAWVDCASGGAKLGRGIFQRARWRDDGDLRPHDLAGALSVPLDLPGFALNRFSVKLFNAIYYRAQRSMAGRQRVHYAAFFYPLDKLQRWNRLYGSRGLYQYQCVLPLRNAESAMQELLAEITRAGAGSFLAVLKTFGTKRSPGLLSFPMEGATLALDFPNRGPATLALMGRLDTIVENAHGRLYAAKDGRMPATMFRAGYPEWQKFASHIDPAVCSDFWRRVGAG